MILPENYIVEHREVKHVRLRVHEDGKVYLFVPMDFTEHEIMKVLEMKAEWIAAKQQYFRQKGKILLGRNEVLLFGNRYAYYYTPQYKNRVVVNEESMTLQSGMDLLDLSVQERWLKGYAGKCIRQRVAMMSEVLMLPYNRLFIRSQRNKWGNCSSKKNVSINWRIIRAPSFVMDYVIIHELCHTVVMKHTVKFDTMLASLCPYYKEAQKWLDVYGNNL